MTAEYNADAQLVSLKPVGALPSRNRTATLKVSCGASDNIATATATVTQLGTEPTLVLDPDHLVIDQQGTAQVVTVLTNQSSWSIDQASVPSWATVTTDAAKNTITVSAQAFNTTGSREFTLKVKAGDLTAELPAVQALTYQVGDIFYKDGKALGVVYETSDNGMHGKVFSFKTYNMSDKILTTTGYTTIPTSRDRRSGQPGGHSQQRRLADELPRREVHLRLLADDGCELVPSRHRRAESTRQLYVRRLSVRVQ